MILGSLIEPGLGLIVWTTITFVLLLVILAKFAWKPILNMQLRNAKIQVLKDALQAAEKAKLEMAELQAGNERILAEARAERDALLKDATRH
jgi:F-type H+-transporting ATPase subunit b